LLIFLILILIAKIKADGATYYISLNSTSQNSLCGDTQENACPSILSALNLIPVNGNGGNNVTFILDDGTYSGANNTNLNIFGYSIVVQPLNEESPKVFFNGSIGTSSAVFINFDRGNTPNALTQLVVKNIVFQSFGNANLKGGIFNSTTVNSNFVLEINGCTFNSNTALQGSVVNIYNDQDNQYDVNITISKSTFNSNNFVLFISEFANLSIDLCSFDGSSTSHKNQLASVLYMNSGLLQITNTNITSSSTSTPINLYGLYGQHFSLINNCIFDSNSIGDDGGVFTISFTLLNITNSVFSNNAAISGAALSAHGSQTYVKIFNSKFLNNRSNGKGGAINLRSSVFSDISNCEFSGNSASSGGSISLEYTELLNLNNCSFDNNDVSLKGGAIFTSFGDINFNQVTITNSNASEGGAVYCAASKLNMPNNTVLANNIDSGNGTDAYEYNFGFKVSVNSYNIYCALDPTYTYCDISGDEPYSSLCGYVEINDKDSGLSKGQLAGIIIGATLGAAVIAFGAAWLISKTTIGEHY
ncbi:hypothetical protein DICPUDRAFT_18219, partial [Dictyostelium purpureum]